MQEAKIKIVTHKIVPKSPVGVVRINPEAEAIVRALQRETGLTARSIVSQIIVQAESLIVCETK